MKTLEDSTMKTTGGVWDTHYRRPRSRLSYPDENLVRLLALAEGTPELNGPALDLGCGSGRHSVLLHERDWSPITGADLSPTAVSATAELVPSGTFITLDESGRLPFADASFSLVVAWGVLHYNAADVRDVMMQEVARVLRPGGWFVGTLRASGESHIQDNADLEGATVELFDRSRAESLLARFFGNTLLGYSERSVLGEPDRRICHWFFRCKDPIG